MDFYDIIFAIIFIVVWLLLVYKVFPKFGIHSWATTTCNLPEGESTKKKELPDSDKTGLDS